MLERKRIARANQKDFRVEKVVKGKGNKLYVNGKKTIVLLTIRLIKKIFRRKSENSTIMQQKHI